ncbi:HDOD domain-containing protein [Simiduia sp. 21SJ11W-1]|uniref:HDOD domain-containing protein n=1 Tax=Simiduia sp. 21SJ11W-1 TaxID=2909669 RepID=UPI00209CFB2D|nr:HDOD domain-containing protein [Simiduia sp. 21SJ11W-1]UTA48108.1 HDOD domain-containing protein [Simiduia sp. 21SJ11W-1]
MPQELTDAQISSLLKGINIPPQPQVLVDLQMEQLDPQCSINALAKIISQDVGLAGAVLKTVNSPFFNLTNKISSIQQAVNLLGIDSVISLVNAHSIRGALSDEQIIALGKFWDTAIDIAQVATHVAKQIGIDSPEEAYTLGLFHNCGIPLLMMRYENYPEVMQRAYADPINTINATENAELHTNHCVVGYYVARSWKLPQHLCQAIHNHHQVAQQLVSDSVDSREKNLLAVLKIAEHFCGNYKIFGQQTEDHEWQRLQEQILIYVGLSQYDFENLRQQLSDQGLL